LLKHLGHLFKSHINFADVCKGGGHRGIWLDVDKRGGGVTLSYMYFCGCPCDARFHNSELLDIWSRKLDNDRPDAISPQNRRVNILKRLE